MLSGAFASNLPSDPQTSTQWKATSGKRLCYQTTVADARRTLRVVPPYQRTVVLCQLVAGSLLWGSNGGCRAPFLRG
ncbi:MAG: hypothetical protein OHK0015_01460 [Chloroflexi bacterium OHK40]